MEQIKEQNRTPEKELSNEEIDNLSEAEFETLVIRILTQLIETGSKMKEEMKVIHRKIGKIYREPTVKGKKPGLKSTI